MLSTRLSLENQKVVRSFVDDDLKLYLPMNGPNINTGLRLLGAGSMEFDGTNDYVDCGNDSSLQITGALSIAAWVKTTATATQRFIQNMMELINVFIWLCRHLVGCLD